MEIPHKKEKLLSAAVRKRKSVLEDYRSYVQKNYEYCLMVCGLDELRDLISALNLVGALNDKMGLTIRDDCPVSWSTSEIMAIDLKCRLEFRYLKRAVDSIKLMAIKNPEAA